ncbi:MBL fold metallo-hydrolase [Bacillus suaedaesalsae]|uniref:MBL fold metallo-hydrolase n=1 Tax=Bacillus suaedaesalsae TaxID=2810349 RepID=A0ABS2DHX8_9BACI|nr:MBL fold metallo-hydrolase [Bacillus suaedaesalsae]MBM6617625.1 MBL fold metallo-hydrolase [Bacillus suaedaesalsae]
MSKITTFQPDRYMIDVYDLGIPNRTGSYLLNEEKKAIIDTSASPSIPHLLQGLTELHISPEEIDYLIVTHIHLDHAGGLGKMLEHCPNAKVIVHPKGAKHIIDPSRLIQGAKHVYGDQFDSLFDPIIPINENNVKVMADGDCLTLSEKCTLTFFDTPGHANHHFSIHDSKSNGVFTGDTIGVNYEAILGHPFFLPSTSPNQFDPEKMLQSAKKIMDLSPSFIYFGHFGGTHQVKDVWEQLQYWIPIFVEITHQVIQSSHSLDEKVLLLELSDELMKKVILEVPTTVTEEAKKLIQLDLQVCSMGLLDYFSKMQ